MGNLEAGCKAFIINDLTVPENNWKVVELIEMVEPNFDAECSEYYIDTCDEYRMIVQGSGFYWKVIGELLSNDILENKRIKDDIRFYKPEQLMPLKGDFKIEHKATENSLSCV